jgi:hypothetical protein
MTNRLPFLLCCYMNKTVRTTRPFHLTANFRCKVRLPVPVCPHFLRNLTVSVVVVQTDHVTIPC